MEKENLPAISGGEAQYALVQVSPDLKLEQGRKAAVSLKRMIDETNSKIKIGNSEHIKAEAWQTVGSFFEVTVKTEVESCEIDGVKGAKATATLIDSMGHVVGGGDSYCMRDEYNWKNKPWVQLASMAQTRSASRALSNKYKWITVMAGFSPTPADEMETEHHAPPAARPAGKPNDPPWPHPAEAAQAAAPGEEKVTFEIARYISEVEEMLGKMNGGDAELMNAQLKTLTKYTEKKSGQEKWLEIENLPNIGKFKPDWLKGVHKKVTEEYRKALDAQGTK